jgi:hypothetical protein
MSDTGSESAPSERGPRRQTFGVPVILSEALGSAPVARLLPEPEAHPARVARYALHPKSVIWNRKGAKDTKENKIAMRTTFTLAVNIVIESRRVQQLRPERHGGSAGGAEAPQRYHGARSAEGRDDFSKVIREGARTRPRAHAEAPAIESAELSCRASSDDRPSLI